MGYGRKRKNPPTKCQGSWLKKKGIFIAKKNGGSAHRINVSADKGRTAGYPEKRKEERCFLRVRDRYLTLYYTIGNLYFSGF